MLSIHTPLEISTHVVITRSDGLVLFDGSNIIVQTAIYDYLQSLTSTYTSSPITTLQIGSGGTYDVQGLNPIVPTRGQTAMNSYLDTVAAAASAPISTSTSVTFTASVPSTVANGVLVSEAGLFNAAGYMMNYITFPAITKSSEFGLNFAWTISI